MTDLSIQPARPTIISRRFGEVAAHLAAPIAPLISTTTLCPHPSFPRTLLAYNLLSSAELDALAAYYHQTSPKRESWTYPAPVAARWRLTSSYLSSAGCSSSYMSPSQYGHFRRRQRRRQAATRLWNSIALNDRALSNNNSSSSNREATNNTPDPNLPDPAIVTEDKRRRFGRFVGLQGCESPGMTTEEMERETGEALVVWVEQEIERRIMKEREEDKARRKGAW